MEGKSPATLPSLDNPADASLKLELNDWPPPLGMLSGRYKRFQSTYWEEVGSWEREVDELSQKLYKVNDNEDDGAYKTETKRLLENLKSEMTYIQNDYMNAREAYGQVLSNSCLTMARYWRHLFMSRRNGQTEKLPQVVTDLDLSDDQWDAMYQLSLVAHVYETDYKSTVSHMGATCRDLLLWLGDLCQSLSEALTKHEEGELTLETSDPMDTSPLSEDLLRECLALRVKDTEPLAEMAREALEQYEEVTKSPEIPPFQTIIGEITKLSRAINIPFQLAVAWDRQCKDLEIKSQSVLGTEGDSGEAVSEGSGVPEAGDRKGTSDEGEGKDTESGYFSDSSAESDTTPTPGTPRMGPPGSLPVTVSTETS
ncbi:hypothetical protein TREMEDRAFT_61480 [Tremella mesenterica DSM 1558]|uniref:uncharacterized protein n=1 Tax=Tremella mesenterica (strain ATCC 24925 / CBS 8224 / DSM 1558 / NBRC 9311 / NRRL Y-6157 / RJB 2259-6 / UBC 559-6) TaxID=578456 RepID=UPI0003F49887|nr:uncharacterized protein TREMEDRAFT_61480 [Tremella mesenterica DSM 1558]EIW69721.1 hypothetical protein TREMEDRAFT_61480 [Tremella mesenterica DSM 1558]